jgi:hypothetical protein
MSAVSALLKASAACWTIRDSPAFASKKPVKNYQTDKKNKFSIEFGGRPGYNKIVPEKTNPAKAGGVKPGV